MRKYMGIEREEIPWFPTIDADLCTGCGQCLEFCANGVFELNDEGIMEVAVEYNCVVGCNKCAEFCPMDAIEFPSIESLKEKLKEIKEAK